MTTRKDSAKWREMLKPLILALIALASATTAYVKSHSEVNEGSERNAVSMAKMETRIELIEQRTSKVERESEILKGTLSDIKSDVSFIRGKMEAHGFQTRFHRNWMPSRSRAARTEGACTFEDVVSAAAYLAKAWFVFMLPSPLYSAYILPAAAA